MFGLPVELRCGESLMPLHSVTASALLNSKLSSKIGHWTFLSEEGDSRTLSEGLWRRARSSGAFTPMDKQVFGIANDVYETGLFFAYIAFIPFCEAGVMDSLSLRIALSCQRSYACIFADTVQLMDLGNGSSWELLQV
ncbi:hypothetical protein BUALT_Bualt16G0034300 [Buddleja alternifolia]|uniref:Uncharacterized protein n=1 Tax=Buddleja alternifolia TaxID=168488 RepID=A0AAV6WH27_9LAMI|nr:hypothetical protein BUALT_Bualt16G0034300 [Buddleja alternifolia]